MKTVDELKERLKRIVQEEFINSWLDSPGLSLSIPDENLYR